MSANASLTIYRDTACGTALTESLNELVVSERLAPDVALRVLRQFDAVMCETLTHHVRETMSIQARRRRRWHSRAVQGRVGAAAGPVRRFRGRGRALRRRPVPPGPHRAHWTAITTWTTCGSWT